MAKTSGLFRVGRDVELRFLNDGTAVANVSLAFNYGKKGDDGNRPTQWIEGALFGQRAETLAPMLTKGSQHVFHLGDCHIETYPKNDGGEGFKMVGRVDDVELIDRKDGGQNQNQGNQRQGTQNQGNQRQPQGNQRQGTQNQGNQRQPQGNQRQGNPSGQNQNRGNQGGNQQNQNYERPANRGGFNDMDDDIPFNDPMKSRAFCLACA